MVDGELVEDPEDDGETNICSGCFMPSCQDIVTLIYVQFYSLRPFNLFQLKCVGDYDYCNIKKTIKKFIIQKMNMIVFDL